MSPEAESETQFSFDSFLPLWTIVFIGVVLLAVSSWLAWRDRRFTERARLVGVLLFFRVGAILILLWMLAGPTLVTTLRKFKRKTIAVLVDTSASMGLVDVLDGSGNNSRWI